MAKYASCSVFIENGLEITLNGKTYRDAMPIKWRYRGAWCYAEGQESHSSYLNARVFYFETPDGDVAVRASEIESDFDFLDMIYPT